MAQAEIVRILDDIFAKEQQAKEAAEADQNKYKEKLADKYGIPVYGSEVEQVKAGCLASVSLDYVALGRTTGKMAVGILNGSDASNMAVETISEATPVINEDVLATLGMELPAAYSSADFVKTE